MANKNPIQVDKPFSSTEFIIPKKYSNTMIYLTIKVDLAGEGWLYASAHSIFLGMSNKYPEKTPEPFDLKLSYGDNLDGQRLSISSHISRIHEDVEDAEEITDMPDVEYTLLIEAGDNLLNEFKAKSGTKNPSDFRSSLVFKIES